MVATKIILKSMVEASVKVNFLYVFLSREEWYFSLYALLCAISNVRHNDFLGGSDRTKDKEWVMVFTNSRTMEDNS